MYIYRELLRARDANKWNGTWYTRAFTIDYDRFLLDFYDYITYDACLISLSNSLSLLWYHVCSNTRALTISTAHALESL